MLYAFNNAVQTLATNEAVVFNTVAIQTGCTATASAGSSAINLNRPGLYMVQFNANAATAAGDVTFTLYQNGVAVGGATATESSTAVTDIQNLGFSAIVRVTGSCCPCDTANNRGNLTVRSEGATDATVSLASIVVTKLA